MCACACMRVFGCVLEGGEGEKEERRRRGGEDTWTDSTRGFSQVVGRIDILGDLVKEKRKCDVVLSSIIIVHHFTLCQWYLCIIWCDESRNTECRTKEKDFLTIVVHRTYLVHRLSRPHVSCIWEHWTAYLYYWEQ